MFMHGIKCHLNHQVSVDMALSSTKNNAHICNSWSLVAVVIMKYRSIEKKNRCSVFNTSKKINFALIAFYSYLALIIYKCIQIKNNLFTLSCCVIFKVDSYLN